MTTLLQRVRCDNKARPWWDAIPSEERAAIVASIPEDSYISIIATNDAPPYSVRVFHQAPGSTVLLAHRRGYTVRETAEAALRAAA